MVEAGRPHRETDHSLPLAGMQFSDPDVVDPMMCWQQACRPSEILGGMRWANPSADPTCVDLGIHAVSIVLALDHVTIAITFDGQDPSSSNIVLCWELARVHQVEDNMRSPGFVLLDFRLLELFGVLSDFGLRCLLPGPAH